MSDQLLYHYKATHLTPTSRERPDGDTMRVRVDLGMQTLRETKLRLNRINCPELSDYTGAGFAARDFMRSLWPFGTELAIRTYIDPTDKYGRWLAEVTLNDGRNLSDEMVAAGHAVYKAY